MTGASSSARKMNFLGSASLFPHVQGMFQEYFVMGERQCYPVAGDVTLGELAFAEPLAVALHARQSGRRPARQVGAHHRRGHDRLPDGDRGAAGRCGARSRCRTYSTGRSRRRSRSAPTSRCAPIATAMRWSRRSSTSSYEVSGSFTALKSCIAAAKRGGVVVQVGTLPHEPLPFVVNEIMAKELDLRGAFRWGIEFDWAVEYLSSRRVDVRPLLSGQYPLQDAVAAFHAAADKNKSTKVQVIMG